MKQGTTNLFLPLEKSQEDVTRYTWMCFSFAQSGTLYDALFFNKMHEIIYDHKDDNLNEKDYSYTPDQIRWWSGINGNELYNILQSLSEEQYTNGKSPTQTSVDYEKPKVVTLRAKYQLTLELPAYAAGCLSYTCRKFNTFSARMLNYFFNHNSVCPVNCDMLAQGDCLNPNITKYLMKINLLEDDRFWLDYKWGERIGCQVWKRMLLDDAMSWLNTLGGGYSALGDYFVHHAEAAGQTSMRQLKIALDMGDPPTVLRCYLYFAISLMQRGYLRRSKYIIRRTLQEAKALPVNDVRLQAMCHGIWSRLKYLYIQRAKNTRAVKDS